MKICSVDGCDTKVRSKGLCSKHYYATPERKAITDAYEAARRLSPERIAYKIAQRLLPQYKAYEAARNSKPERKLYNVVTARLSEARNAGLLCSCCSLQDLIRVYKESADRGGCEVDHRIPSALGGLTCVSNLQILTIQDHRAKLMIDGSHNTW
jgi:5-methylcytosine-specific restriction endonuclease McrA